MTREQFITIKEYLESKNIINISNEETKMDIRKNGHEYTMEEHVAGMLYSLLSAQTVWKNIERNMTNINQLFFNFDIEKIKHTDYTYFYNGLGQWGARGRLTKAQLRVFHYNISVMEKIVEEYGSMDIFVESAPLYEVIAMLSNPKSKYKFKMMGEALVCEYLRNVGIDCFKLDTHLVELLGKNRIGLKSGLVPSFQAVYEEIHNLSIETGLWMAQIDYTLWAFGATGFGEVCSAKPRCSICPIREGCNRNEIQ